MKIGVIGAGAVSRVHINAYSKRQDVQIAGIADLNEKAAKALADKYEVPQITVDYHHFLEDKSIQVVDICLPHFLHHQVTLEAFEAGKDVILEKPISMTIEEADDMITTAEKKGRRFFVALNQRFLPAHQRAKELLSNGEIGKPFFCLAVCIGDEMPRMDDPTSWKGTWDKAGGGAMADTGTHFIDLMHYFFGLPNAVTATMKRLVVTAENKADDCSTVTLEFPDNFMAEVVVTYAATSDIWSEKKDIYGLNGSIHICNEAEKPLFIVKDKGSPQYLEVEHNPVWWEYSVGRGVNHFVDCILQDKEPIVRPEEAKLTLQTILSAYRASKEGRRLELNY